MQKNNPVKNFSLISSEADDELILYNGEYEVVHVLNSTAKLVWELCDAQHSPEEIAKIVSESFVIQPDRDVLADVIDTLVVFSEKGLLKYPE